VTWKIGIARRAPIIGLPHMVKAGGGSCGTASLGEESKGVLALIGLEGSFAQLGCRGRETSHHEARPRGIPGDRDCLGVPGRGPMRLNSGWVNANDEKPR
jgi:hypothetical protein